MTGSNPKSSLAEDHRLHETKTGEVNWKQWGPYLAERARGTVLCVKTIAQVAQRGIISLTARPLARLSLE